MLSANCLQPVIHTCLVAPSSCFGDIFEFVDSTLIAQENRMLNKRSERITDEICAICSEHYLNDLNDLYGRLDNVVDWTLDKFASNTLSLEPEFSLTKPYIGITTSLWMNTH